MATLAAATNMPALGLLGEDGRLEHSTEAFRRWYKDREELLKQSPELQRVLAYDLMCGCDHGTRDACLACRRGNELGARPAQCELSAGRPLLLAHEAGHSGDDEQEEGCGRGENDHVVDAVQAVGETDARRDETGDCEQHEPRPRQPAPALDGGLLERAHGRVERSRSPENEVRDPADVVDDLMVVRVLQQRVVVRAVRGEDGDDACDEEVEGGRAFAGCGSQSQRQRECKAYDERSARGGAHDDVEAVPFAQVRHRGSPVD